ncbi:MAG: hypothetical protein ACR2KT_00415 [Methylocella sp.]
MRRKPASTSRAAALKDGLASGFRVGKEDRAAFDIDMLPLRVQDFTKARASQDQEPDRRRCERIKLHPPLIRLRRVLRVRLRAVHLVGQADGFAFPERIA